MLDIKGLHALFALVTSDSLELDLLQCGDDALVNYGQNVAPHGALKQGS